MAEVPLVRFEHVSTRFGRELVVDDIDGELAPGDALAIVGPNGAGKTTLMRLVVGLLEPTEGSVRIDGRSVTEAKSEVAYVQQTSAFDPGFPASVLDVVLMGRYRRLGWFRRPSKEDRRIAMAALEEVGLSNRARHRFGLLSGGQRQRVLFARALAQQAKVMLLDEPFNGVDQTTIDISLDVLAKVREQGMTIIVSTHDLDVARSVCNKVLLMNRRQFAFGATAEVLSPEKLSETFGAKSMSWLGGHSVVTT